MNPKILPVRLPSTEAIAAMKAILPRMGRNDSASTQQLIALIKENPAGEVPLLRIRGTHT